LTRVSVAFICDSLYVIPTIVAITSLLCNKNPDTYLDIHIVAAELSNEEINKFYEFCENKVSIHIIRVTSEKFSDIPKSFHITSTACFKFDLPYLIPHENKVLYLDSDIIIQKDLSDLFKTNINHYYAGVVKDIVMIDNDLNIKDYFNSGVMILNLELMRENDMPATLLNMRKTANNLTFVDQDCFNILFNKKVKLLPVTFNCFYYIFLRFKRFPIDFINKYFGTNYSSFEDLKEDSHIIHMAGNDKPWIYYNSISAREWDGYFQKSPFRFHQLKRKSIKTLDFIELHNALRITSYLFYLWRKRGFRFAMRKAKKYFIRKKKNNSE